MDNLKNDSALELPHLVNRGDGVDGHYCICRMHPKGYRETWDEELKKWCSAGTVFKLGKAKMNLGV